MVVKPIEKKVIGRNKAISLGVICIILAASLVGTLTYYADLAGKKDSIIAARDSQISNQNSQIADQNSRISYLDRHTMNLTSIVNLDKSTVWVNNQTIANEAGFFTYWTFSPDFAGYATVYIHATNITSTYVNATYSAYGLYYTNEVPVATQEEAIFPLLPCTNLRISVGSFYGEAGDHTLTITYYY